MFTVFDAVLVKKLPVQDQDRIVELAGLSKGAAREVPITIEQLGRFRTQTRTLRDVAGFAHWRIAEGGGSDGDRVAMRPVVGESGTSGTAWSYTRYGNVKRRLCLQPTAFFISAFPARRPMIAPAAVGWKRLLQRRRQFVAGVEPNKIYDGVIG